MSLKRNRILDCFSERESETDQPCNTLKILTWNVDGLCIRFPIERAENAIEEIIKECADVITLQEVTHNTVDVFTTYLESAGYSICGSNHFTFPYFTISFVRAGLSTRAQRNPYTGAALSQGQGRDMDTIYIEFADTTFLVINAHLESTKECSLIRTAQLQVALSTAIAHNGPAVLCGDLNMRDKEVQQVEKILGKGKFVDAWKSTGCDPAHKFTWSAPDGSGFQCRFDRVYSTIHSNLRAKTFKSIGQKTLPAPINSTISDHYGLVVEFEFRSSTIISGSSVSNGEAESSYSSARMKLQKSTRNEVVDLTRNSDEEESRDRSDAEGPPLPQLECPSGLDPTCFAALPRDFQLEQIQLNKK